MGHVLIIEDADSLREALGSVLQSNGHTVSLFSTAEAALAEPLPLETTCILADFKLPGLNGIQLLEKVRESDLKVPFVLMTAYGSIDIAVDAMKRGANDFITKPFEPETLHRVVAEVTRSGQITDRSPRTRFYQARTYVTQSSAGTQLLHDAKKIARVDTTTLLLGESGSGKELVARYIHEHSSRAEKPFVAINCSAIPAQLLESEFFGHEAGAYTGATQSRVGIFEYASQGTIFFDEVGDMPPQLQVKLLRALQEREIKRLGGSKTIKVNPRIISATNQDIETLIGLGRLREDFYYRIAVAVLTTPSLRQRREDIPLIIEHMLNSLREQSGRELLSISDEALQLLVRYPWPGNVRELENVIERAVIQAENQIRPEHLGIQLPLDVQSLHEAALSLTQASHAASRKAEESLIRETLAITFGNKTKAAIMLGVSYKTLLNKAKEFGLNSADDERA